MAFIRAYLLTILRALDGHVQEEQKVFVRETCSTTISFFLLRRWYFAKFSKYVRFIKMSISTQSFYYFIVDCDSSGKHMYLFNR